MTIGKLKITYKTQK